MVSDDFVKRFAEAVARAEGFFVPDSVPARIHNPCDLSDEGDVGCGVFQTSGPNGAALTIYATDEDGWNAAYRKFRRMLDGASHVYTLDMTLLEVALKYAGSAAWGQNVANALGVDTQTTLAELAAANLDKQDV
jgi:hypothetical protein